MVNPTTGDRVIVDHDRGPWGFGPGRVILIADHGAGERYRVHLDSGPQVDVVVDRLQMEPTVLGVRADLIRRAIDVFRLHLEDEDAHTEDAVRAAVVYALGQVEG